MPGRGRHDSVVPAIDSPLDCSADRKHERSGWSIFLYLSMHPDGCTTGLISTNVRRCDATLFNGSSCGYPAFCRFTSNLGVTREAHAPLGTCRVLSIGLAHRSHSAGARVISSPIAARGEFQCHCLAGARLVGHSLCCHPRPSRWVSGCRAPQSCSAKRGAHRLVGRNGLLRPNRGASLLVGA